MRLRWSSATIVLLSLLSLAASTSFAQRQIAFDARGSVYILTKSLERQARIFEMAGFEEARMYALPDSTYLLELTFADSLGFRRETRVITVAEVRSLRQRWAQNMGAAVHDPPAEPPREPLSEEGRDQMVQTITGLGIGWYGWTIPAMIGGDSGPLPFTLYLMTAGVTYFAADGFLANRSYSEGEASAFMYFATRGILHGYALSTLATGAYDELRLGFAAGTLVSLVEGLTISQWAGRQQVPVGRIRAIGAIGDAGLLIGLGAAYASSPSVRAFLDDAGDRPRPYAVGVLAGSASGLLIGRWIAGSDGFAPGDAMLMETAGYLGAAAGFTIADLAGVKDRRSLVLGAMSGLVGGQVVGGIMASKVDLTNGEGRRIGLLTSGGILVGLGVAYAIDQDGGRTHYWSIATLGGIAGLMAAKSTVGRGSANSGAHASLEVRPDGLFRPVERREGEMLTTVRPFLRLTVAVR